MLQPIPHPPQPFTNACPPRASLNKLPRSHRSRIHADGRSDSERQQSSGSGPPLKAEEATDFVKWGGTLQHGRRAVVGGLGGLAIALVGNLGGMSSFLLSLDGGSLAAKSRVDVLIPVNGYKRAYNNRTGYEFQFPSSWLVDQRLYRRAVEQAEVRRGLDPPSLRRQDVPERRVAEPQVAYGPPGSTGEENVSIIAAPIQSGFRLQGLGSAEKAGQRFLSTTIAPPGSGLEAQLLSATERLDEQGTLYYTIEYTVKSPKFHRHNSSVYGIRGGLLYTLNVQCPQDKFEAEASVLRPITDSFNIL